jgi:hypothetical protein
MAAAPTAADAAHAVHARMPAPQPSRLLVLMKPDDLLLRHHRHPGEPRSQPRCVSRHVWSPRPALRPALRQAKQSPSISIHAPSIRASANPTTSRRKTLQPILRLNRHTGARELVLMGRTLFLFDNGKCNRRGHLDSSSPAGSTFRFVICLLIFLGFFRHQSFPVHSSRTHSLPGF